jgi:tagatose 6-phosphate kinase
VTVAASAAVVCVALSPALDLTYVGEHFTVGEANRVGQVHARAGGKAVNVARLLHQAGHDVVITGFAGGLTGEEIKDRLDRDGLRHCLMTCAAASRRTVSAFSTADGLATGYYENGPPVTDGELAGFTGRFRQLARGAVAIVLSGSLPGGCPADAYRTLAELAAGAGCATFVDAQGGPLRAALPARPTLVKPNEHELAESAGLVTPVSVPAAVKAARRLLADGAQSVVVTLGARGLLGVLPGVALLAVAPAQQGNPVGAGDAALAALVEGHLAGQPWPDRLRRAAAMSAAAVRQHIAGVVSADDIEELESLVRMDEA